MDPGRLKYLAQKGMMGHAALLDPDTHVAQVMAQLPGPLVAQNTPNELGITGDYATLGQKRAAAPKDSYRDASDPNVDKKIQDALRQRLMNQGHTPEEIASALGE